MAKYEKYYLQPSGVYVVAHDCLIHTVLGSCVAVCLYDPENAIGGMNHYMLPLWNGDGLESPRYGNVAIYKLIEEMIKLGVKKENIVAKIFGGGKILNDINTFHVGERNIAIAYKILGEEGIPVLASSTGGDRGRKIIFRSSTGEVLQKYLNKSV
ncbi:chemotaxis protein CheD [Sunxiuqinia sp. A32]|uniref:chemotaxis protein CheD n=1 Tax=Sunxiuqinia sp. A32 TaxID=3461496 RepID=UPI0040465066